MSDHKFKKGVSGNPKGRPKSDNSGLRDKLRQAMPEIIEQLINQAKAGDMQAIKLILDKTVPNLKPTGATVSIIGLIATDEPENQAQAIVSAMAGGLVDTSTGSELLYGIERLMSIREKTDLEKRIKALEAKNGIN